jgi:hypothetical protein
MANISMPTSTTPQWRPLSALLANVLYTPMSNSFYAAVSCVEMAHLSSLTSSQVNIPITNTHCALCKEQQHSQKQGLFVIMVKLKLLRIFKPAGLTACILFFSLCSFLLAHLKFLCYFLYSGGYSAVSKLSPDALL